MENIVKFLTLTSASNAQKILYNLPNACLLQLSISIKMEVGVFISFFRITIYQNYWTHLHAVFFFKIILVLPRRFIAPKSIVLFNPDS